MAYTNQPLLEAYLQRNLTDSEVAALPIVVEAAKQWIDSQLNSTFDSATATTRYYEGSGGSLDIDPCTSVTAITSNDSDNVAYYTYETSDYMLEPVNETVKREIRLRHSNWPRGTGNIAVTAIFSEYDSGVPEDIKLAATRIVGGVLNAGKYAGQGENLQSESLEGHSVSYDTTQSGVDTLADSDPILKGILEGRKDVMIW